MSFPLYLLLELFLIYTVLIIGLLINRVDRRYQFFVFSIGLLISIGTLVVFKVQSRVWMMPLGLSFQVFQGVAYLIEVYRKHWKPESNLITFAAYSIFYPQLAAGPIERPQHLFPQLHHPRTFSVDQLIEGLKRITWGVFKKVVIADRIALLIQPLFDNPMQGSTTTLFIAAILFSFQLYADFSGYCDIAIGIARILGFSLSENFNLPFIATSITDFWNRWHLTLSRWFRDYVFIPMGGSRQGLMKTIMNIMLVFVLSGIWHGSGWNFIVWGLTHGFLVSTERLLGRYFSIPKPLSYVLTFPKILITFILVSLTWILFRSPTIQHAQLYYSQLLSFQWSEDFSIFPITELLISLIGIAGMIGVESTRSVIQSLRYPRLISFFAQYVFYYVVILSIIFFSVTQRQFIYVQF